MLGTGDPEQARDLQKLVLARCMALGKFFLPYEIYIFLKKNIFKLFPLTLPMHV